MIKKITCRCDCVFEQDIPQTVNLDQNEKLVSDILDGSFLSFVCPQCGASLRLEYELKLEWKEKTDAPILFLPELDRLAFFNNKNDYGGAQVVIGYPELVERIITLKHSLDPFVIESIKLFLLEKIYEEIPNAKKASLALRSVNEDGSLVFYAQGLKPNESAVMNVSKDLYAQIKEETAQKANEDPYAALVHNNYISVKNINMEDSL